MKIEEASDERDRSAVVSGQIHSAAASNPFRSEDGGGRRVKPRHSIQVKNSSKQSTFDSHDAKKRRSSSVHGEIQGDGVRTSTSPACRDTSNPDPHAQAAGDVDVQSGGAGILQWEPSEHDGLLSAQDGRKRWFRCTK